MINVTEENMTLSCRAGSRDEALRLAAFALQTRGLVTEAFSDAILAREHEMSTWLGSGVAMPHCARKDGETILATGYHILQFPDGVKWQPGRIVFLVVVVAARADEHIDVLAGLADLLDDERLITLLAKSQSKPQFVSLLMD